MPEAVAILQPTFFNERFYVTRRYNLHLAVYGMYIRQCVKTVPAFEKIYISLLYSHMRNMFTFINLVIEIFHR